MVFSAIKIFLKCFSTFATKKVLFLLYRRCNLKEINGGKSSISCRKNTCSAKVFSVFYSFVCPLQIYIKTNV